MNVERYIDLITELLRKELRARYQRLSLGYLWSIANPLAFAGLYYIVFNKILKVQNKNYPLFLISSLFPWQWISNSISVGSVTFIGNAPLIKKTLFPRHLIPLVVTLQDLIHFCISIPIIILFVYLFHQSLEPSFFFLLPILLIIQFVLTYSLNLFIATVSVFFRDLERLIQICMTFLFYMTPVLYSESLIPPQYQNLIIFHPLAPLIINWRNLFMNAQFNWNYCLSSILWAFGLLLLSQFTYKKLSWRFAEVL